MTEEEREELIGRMALTMFAYVEDQSRLRLRDLARAALAVTEPVIREQTESALRGQVEALDNERNRLWADKLKMQGENARLREALKPFSDAADKLDGQPDRQVVVMLKDCRAARAAIREEKTNDQSKGE